MLVVAVPPAHPPSCLQMVELRTTEMANSDLEKYHKVLLTVLPPYCGFLLLLVLAGVKQHSPGKSAFETPDWEASERAAATLPVCAT